MKTKSIIESLICEVERERKPNKAEPLNFPEIFGAYININKEKVLKKCEEHKFSVWKSTLIKYANELNKKIDPSFRFYPDLFSWGDKLSIRKVKRDNTGKLTQAGYTEIKLKDKIGFVHASIYEEYINLNCCKKTFDLLFPKSKIYIVAIGNLSRDTLHFRKKQKLQLLFHGNAGGGYFDRSAWLGFNRKTKKYEAHNIYNKFIVNIRYKLVGSIPNHSAALYD